MQQDKTILHNAHRVAAARRIDFDLCDGFAARRFSAELSGSRS